MNILGITSGSESGACLFQNGQIQLAVSEERLSLENSHPETFHVI